MHANKKFLCLKIKKISHAIFTYFFSNRNLTLILTLKIFV